MVWAVRVLGVGAGKRGEVLYKGFFLRVFPPFGVWVVVASSAPGYANAGVMWVWVMVSMLEGGRDPLQGTQLEQTDGVRHRGLEGAMGWIVLPPGSRLARRSATAVRRCVGLQHEDVQESHVMGGNPVATGILQAQEPYRGPQSGSDWNRQAR